MKAFQRRWRRMMQSEIDDRRDSMLLACKYSYSGMVVYGLHR